MNPAAAPVPAPETVARTSQLRSKPVAQWTNEDVRHISDPANFSAISENHMALNTQLEKLVEQKGMRHQDAKILRTILSQTDLPYMMDDVMASRTKTFDGQDAPENALGVAHLGLGDRFVQLVVSGCRPRAKSISVQCPRDINVTARVRSCDLAQSKKFKRPVASGSNQ